MLRVGSIQIACEPYLIRIEKAHLLLPKQRLAEETKFISHLNLF